MAMQIDFGKRAAYTEPMDNLFSLRTLQKAKREGYDAALHGIEADACPYTSVQLAKSWTSGWKNARLDKIYQRKGVNDSDEDQHRRNERRKR